jgi:hypothetical protein
VTICRQLLIIHKFIRLPLSRIALATALQDRRRLGVPPGHLVCAGEVVAGAERVGVLGAEDPLAVGEQRLEDRDRLRHMSGVPVGEREVVAGRERVGVLGTEEPLKVLSSGS